MESATHERTKERLLRFLALGVVALVAGVFCLGLALAHEGREAMERSDAAFHRAEMVDAIAEARTAALAYVPGSEHVRRAERRLEAIARGAEAQGDWQLARRAWDALRLVTEQTDYPGRPVSTAGERARAALQRLDGRVAEPQH